MMQLSNTQYGVSNYSHYADCTLLYPLNVLLYVNIAQITVLFSGCKLLG